MKTTIQNPFMGHSKTRSKREVYRNTILTQEIRKISNKEPNFTPKKTRERKKKTTPKVSRNKFKRSKQKKIRDKNNNSKDQKSKS